ncbi:OadG family transporter subunit [Aliidiomarina celeris]|uniref:OadG family transporter subunit n=1 Tax=Aliidiomarina celeris TaxID=2249428 RepID=UPI000DEA939F|nr:OadG family transporter subunit [Aliidiomarina celeris]
MQDLLTNAAELMLVGLGVVFVFLVLLTLVTYLLVFLCPEREASEVEAASPRSTSATPAQVAAIGVAVQRFRASAKRSAKNVAANAHKTNDNNQGDS